MKKLTKGQILTATAGVLALFLVVLVVARRPGLSPVEVRRQVTAVKPLRQAKSVESLLAASSRTKAVVVANEGNAPPSRASSEDIEETEVAASEARAPTTKEICAADWQALTQMSLDLLRHDVSQGRLSLSVACRDAMLETPEGGTSRWFISNCTTGQVLPPEVVDRCVAETTSFRASLFSERPEVVEDYQSLAPETLVVLLAQNFRDPSALSEAELNQSVQAADAVIAYDPDVYVAYETKLAAMLLSEARFGTQVDDGAYAEVLGTMSSFRQTADKEDTVNALATRREELTSEQSEIAASLDGVAGRRGEIADELKARAPGTQSGEDGMALLIEDRALEQQRRELKASYDEIDHELEAEALHEPDGSDPTLVRVPFMRLLAKGDYSDLADAANEFMEEYPNSPLGPYYLAQAYWRTGQRDQAEVVIKNLPGSETERMLFRQSVERAAAREPAAEIEDFAAGLKGAWRAEQGAEQQ